jgi:hypothetical protein
MRYLQQLYEGILRQARGVAIGDRSLMMAPGIAQATKDALTPNDRQKCLDYDGDKFALIH